jgi:hypothetical protein
MFVQESRDVAGSSLVAADRECGELRTTQREICSTKSGRQRFHRNEVEITDLADDLDELGRFVVLVEHELAAGDAAIDVRDRTGNE